MYILFFKYYNIDFINQRNMHVELKSYKFKLLRKFVV